MKIIKAGCFLIDKNTSHIALIYRQKQNDYTFPKGHLENGEDIKACAIRETEEEIKRKPLILDNIDPIVEKYVTPRGEDCECFMFFAIDNGESENQSADAHDLLWVHYQDVKNRLTYQSQKNMWNRIRPIIEKILK